MAKDETAAHYARLHSLETPASRLIRDTIWGRDNDVGQQSFITPRYLDDLIARLRLDESNRVLDLGCGVGGPAVYVSRQCGANVTGIDLVGKGLEVARGLAEDAGVAQRTSFLATDALHMSFADASFDVAMSLNVMNVFDNKLAVFREMRRVLEPGGTLAVLSGTFEIDDDTAAMRGLTREGTVPIFVDSISSYREKIEAAGFVVQEVTEYVDDFRVQISKWRDAYRLHADAIAQEQGDDRVPLHFGYFDTYVALVESGRASNHLVIATAR